MPKEKKIQIVDELAKNLAESEIIIATSYRGLKVTQLNQLRRQLQSKNVKYQVAKNTLTKIAAEKTGKQNINPLLSGPVALAFGFNNIADAAKILMDYQRTQKLLEIKGGLLMDKYITADQVRSLTTLPPKEVLIAKMLGSMQTPISSFVGILNAPLQAFTRVLQARATQLEKAGS